MRKLRTVIALAVITTAALVQAQAAAHAFSSTDITFASPSVNVGSPLTFTAKYVYNSSCSVTAVGARRGKPATFKVRNDTVQGKLSTRGLPAGRYQLSIKCGSDAPVRSSAFFIVPKGSPTRATCDVAEQGFTAGVNRYFNSPGDLTYGVRLVNASPALTATRVELAVSFFDASGTLLKTISDIAYDIPPGGETVTGLSSLRSYDGALPGVASMRIQARCQSEVDQQYGFTPGQAAWMRADRNNVLEFGGTITNSQSFTMDSRNSGLNFVIRDAAGNIIGGGGAGLDAFAPPAGQTTWSKTNEVIPPGQSARIDYLLQFEEPAT